MRWRAPMQIYPDLQRAEPFFLPNLSGVTDDTRLAWRPERPCIIQRQRFPCKDKGNQNRHPFCGDIPGQY